MNENIENIIYLLSGVIGFFVARFCRKHIYHGKSLKEKRALKYEENGGVTYGTCFNVELYRSGDCGLEGDELREDVLKIEYHYVVNGITYKTYAKLLNKYPSKIKIYYDINNPKKHITSIEINKMDHIRKALLLSILITALSIGISGNIMLKLYRYLITIYPK